MSTNYEELPLIGEKDETIISTKDPVKVFLRETFAALAVSLTSLCIGFSLAYTSPAFASMQELNKTYSLNLTERQTSVLGSVMPLFGGISAVLSGAIINFFGSKITMLLCAGPYILSNGIIFVANGFAVILIGRILCGCAVGVLNAANVIYLCEVLPPNKRGRNGMIPTVCGNFSVVLCYFLGSFLNWKHLALVGMFMAAPYTVMVPFVPSSPVWLARRRTMDEVESALRWFKGSVEDVTDELNHLKTEHESEDLWTSSELGDKSVSFPFLIGLFLMFLSQASGISPVIFYEREIVVSPSGQGFSSDAISIIIGLCNLFATLLAPSLSGKLGRKTLLYISFGVMPVAHFFIGLLFFLKNIGIEVHSYWWLALFCLFIIGFSIGAGPVIPLVCAEILPNEIRRKIFGLVLGANFLFTSLFTKIFLDLAFVIGYGAVFWGLCVITALSNLFIFYFVPETRNKTFAEIQKQVRDIERRRFHGRK